MGCRGRAPAPVPCKVCGLAAPHWFDLPSAHGPPALALHLCRGCGLLFVGTPLDEATLRAAYDAIDSPALYASIAETLGKKLERALAEVAPWLRPGARLLDVGCGPGPLLERLPPHVTGEGLELPGARAEAARARGWTVHTVPLGALEGRYDVIAMLDLAEHVLDPVRLFREARARLAPGGVLHLHSPRRCAWDSAALALVRVPGARGLARSWLRLRVSIFHLQLFSDRSLRLALERAGFAAVSLRAEQELGWPLEVYLERHLGHLPGPARALVLLLTRIVVGAGLLRNKALVTAQPNQLSGTACVGSSPLPAS